MATPFWAKCVASVTRQKTASSRENSQCSVWRMKWMTSLAALITTQFQTHACTCVHDMYMTKTERVCWLIHHLDGKNCHSKNKNFKWQWRVILVLLEPDQPDWFWRPCHLHYSIEDQWTDKVQHWCITCSIPCESRPPNLLVTGIVSMWQISPNCSSSPLMRT